jgi:arylsulfatase A-like enzyme
MIKPAMEWASQDTKPFLLTVFTSVAHGPGEYNLPDGFETTKKEPYEKYLQTVRYTDHFLEQLYKALKDHGFGENMIFCVVGDHGGSFRADADNERWKPYEEVIRVPWVIHWPEHIHAGQHIDWPCSQLDVTATILKLTGFDITNAEFDGKDAFVFSEPNRRLYFSSWHHKSPIGFIEGNRKIVYWPYLNEMFEYDLKADPEEENPQTVSADEMEKIKLDILNWQEKSQIMVDPKHYKERLLFSHWKTRGAYRSAWTYYVP